MSSYNRPDSTAKAFPEDEPPPQRQEGPPPTGQCHDTSSIRATPITIPSLHAQLPPLQTTACPLCFPAKGQAGNDDYVVCVAMDGNNSLKRRDRSTESYQDHASRYRLPSGFVNKFSDQTITAQRGQRRSSPAPANFQGGCSSHWKAAQERPRANQRYSETGWFPLVCRHGIVLAYTDMIKEYENSKFPLALVHWFATEYPGRIIFGYDIGCSFDKTFRHAPALSHLAGPDRTDSRIQFRKSDCYYTNQCLPLNRRCFRVNSILTEVGAWHGYAHQRPCQVSYHPRLTAQAGLEDFETCERLFSFTNGVAGVTRSATRFHRHQQLEWVIEQCNNDKLSLMGEYISLLSLSA